MPKARKEKDEQKRICGCIVLTGAAVTVSLWGAASMAEVAEIAQPGGSAGLPFITCVAQQTGGFHDYPGGDETYEPALFHPQSFTLEENPVFMLNLAGEDGAVDLYLTLTRAVEGDSATTAPETTELECRKVRGANSAIGYSCVNLPPSEMLLINAQTLRYTRTAVGGWTFAGAAGELSGDSIFVEYGQCAARED